MSIPGSRNKIKQAGFYIPFTLYFVLFSLAAFAAWRYLHHRNIEADTAFADIFTLLLKVIVFFAGVLLLLALLSVSASLIYFLYHRKKGINFKLTTDLKESELHQKQTVRIFIQPILKPFFGFLKLRLQYDEVHFSPKFSLNENSKTGFFSTTVDGVYHWPLPQIKEYHVHRAILYFEDFFQFFSFAVHLNASNHFATQPSTLSKPPLKVLPRKTEETSTRIEELRKVEGEYLNYKNFENNDDVRRIVWKIYAKNKELVVRIPEIMDPYASHVYLFASFFTGFNIEGNKAAEVPFLNYYKTMVWSIYQNLVKQGFEVKYIADQVASKKAGGDEQQAVKYQVSTSTWQSDADLRSYVKTRDASIVIISSLSDATQVQELVERHGNDITFIFVPLTESLHKHNMLNWLQWVFVQNEKNDMEVYKTAWATSFALRPKITENEKLLKQIIAKYQSPVEV